VHVGVEKTVAEHLVKKNLHPGAGEARNVTPMARSASTWLIGVPLMRCITITEDEQ